MRSDPRLSPRHDFVALLAVVLSGFVVLAILVPEAWLVVIPLAFLVAIFAFPGGPGDGPH